MRVADGVLVHRGELLQNQTVVVQGRSGVVFVDPGITTTELARLAGDSRNGWRSCGRRRARLGYFGWRNHQRRRQVWHGLPNELEERPSAGSPRLPI